MVESEYSKTEYLRSVYGLVSTQIIEKGTTEEVGGVKTHNGRIGVIVLLAATEPTHASTEDQSARRTQAA